MKATIAVESLDLSTLSPHLREQFKHCLTQIREAFQDESPLLGGEKRKATITLKLEFTHVLENRSTDLTSSMNVKLPAYRSTKQHVRLPHGSTQFLVDDDDINPDMFRDYARGEQ